MNNENMNQVNNQNVGNANSIPQQETPNLQPQPVPVQPVQQPVEQPNMNNQIPNDKKPSSIVRLLKILVICIIMVGVVIGIGFIAFQSMNNKPKENNSNNQNNNINQNVEDTSVEATEVEVSNPESYNYLIERLEKIEWCKNIPIDQYLNMSNLSNETLLGTAIAGFSSANLSYKASDVENEIKKIYGKNTKIEHQSFSAFKYDENNKLYSLPDGVGCSLKPIFSQIINKVTQKDNNIYIYVSAGYVYIDNDTKTKICYDFISDDEINNYYNNNSEIKTECINSDDKYFNSSNLEQYMKDNKDKFAKYKYTFEKEDDNYIIKGLEKID